MDHETAPVVPANRLLEIAGLLSDGAARLHDQLRHLPAAERDALLDGVVGQVGDIVAAWSALVRAVVVVDDREPAPAAPPASRAPTSSPAPPSAAPPPPVREGAGPASGPPGGLAAPAEEPAGGSNGGLPEWQRHVQPLTAVPPPSSPSTSQAPAWAPTIVEDGPADDLDEAQSRLTRDELTGALNRQAGFAALAREVDRSLSEGTGLVLGYLNVDGLRHVNDTAGPRAGDELLRKVAAALRATLRSYDMVMRLAGDEFLFALPSADLATAEQRLREFTVILNEEAPGATASVGFAELRDGDAVDDLVARADDALVEARRRRGRPRLR